MNVTNFLKRPVFALPTRQELPSLRHFIERLWRIFAGTVLLLLLSFVIFVSISSKLDERRSDGASLVYLLGRQQMLSQKFSHLALQAERGNPALQAYYLEHLHQVVAELTANEDVLRSGTLWRHTPGSRLPKIQELLENVDAPFLEIAKILKKLSPETGAAAPLSAGLSDAITEECNVLSESLDRLAMEITTLNAETGTQIRFLNWLQITVTGGIALAAALILTRSQISTMKRLIDTSVKLQELTYLQNAVLESATYSIISTNTKGVIATFNCGAEKLTGYRRQEVVGVHTLELFHDDSELRNIAVEISEELGMHVAPGFEALVVHTRFDVVHEREWTYVQKNGSRVPVTLNVTAMRDSEGQITGFLGVAADITEKKKLEQQFLRAQRIESVGTLAGGIAHDLNNVLTPVLMSIELLRVTSTNERSATILNSIESSARRGADLVRQILMFSRGVEGRRSELNAGRFIQDIQQLIQDTFPKNIHCAISLPTDLPVFLGDPTQIHQILLNLCVNARDAMPSGGTLTITAGSLVLDKSAAAMQMDAKPGAYASISVKDTGTGIAPEVLDKIFDPFFTTKEIGKGTGLGLSTVLSITRSHGGFVKFCSEQGQGTTFTICLPVLTGTGHSDGRGPEAGPESAVEPPLHRGKGELILIVDDEEEIRSITQQTLEALDYRTLVAADGVEAVAIYTRHSTEIAAVLTDMMMPVMDGITTIQMLQRINPAVKIIAASGVTHLGGPARVAEMGVRHFLPKPYTAQTVVKTLHLVLHPSKDWEGEPAQSMTL